MNASHSFPGVPPRRTSRPRAARRMPLENASARRFSIALACLGVSYALAWVELPLGQTATMPADGASAAGTALAAAVMARVLVGLLYAFVALRHAWARWITVLLCFTSAALVAPLLPLEWQVFQLGALVTGAGLICKLLAAILLTLPLRVRRDANP
jgi:predicted anti-sigma-YlaC factor YlaD